MSNTQTELEQRVNSIAQDLSNGIVLTLDEHEHLISENGQEAGDIMSAMDYLSDVLDIEYIISSRREYLGARILVAFGGPNIWINTRTEVIEGYWWGEEATASFNDAMDIDDAMRELWESGS